MGININTAERLIRHRVYGHLKGGTIMTLGRLFLDFSEMHLATLLSKYGIVEFSDSNEIILDERTAEIWNRLKKEGRFYRIEESLIISDELFFMLIGFDKVIALDFSDYQNADVMFDMNSTGILEKLGDPVDLVVDAGTLEHLLHIPNALQNMHDALKVGGSVFHASPMNNFPEHGFFQFSATFYNDYYTANHYKIHSVEIVECQTEDTVNSPQMSMEYDFLRLKPYQNKLLKNRTLAVMIMAEKTPESRHDVIPIQRKYRHLNSSVD